MPFLDTVARKHLLWEIITKRIIGRLHILPVLKHDVYLQDFALR